MTFSKEHDRINDSFSLLKNDEPSSSVAVLCFQREGGSFEKRKAVRSFVKGKKKWQE